MAELIRRLFISSERKKPPPKLVWAAQKLARAIEGAKGKKTKREAEDPETNGRDD